MGANTGHRGAWLRKALDAGDFAAAYCYAYDLPRVGLAEAARLVALYEIHRPDHYERAAVRWLERYAAEAARSPRDVLHAASALSVRPMQLGELLELLG